MPTAEPVRLWRLNERGLLVFERRNPPALLVSEITACPTVECTCHAVGMRAVEVEAGSTVGLDGFDELDEVALRRRLEGGVVMRAEISLDVAGVEPDALDGASPLAPAWVELVEGALDGELLDELHHAVLRAKGLALAPQPEAAREMTGLIPWSEVYRHARIDMYDAPEGLYAAEEHYCVEPRCPCKEVCVSFTLAVPDDASAPRRDGEVAVRASYDTQTVVAHEASPAERPLLDQLWSSFVARHPRWGTRCAERKRLMSDALYPRPVVAPVRPGRNDPCGCGSGKKYKRCCGV